GSSGHAPPSSDLSLLRSHLRCRQSRRRRDPVARRAVTPLRRSRAWRHCGDGLNHRSPLLEISTTYPEFPSGPPPLRPLLANLDPPPNRHPPTNLRRRRLRFRVIPGRILIALTIHHNRKVTGHPLPAADRVVLARLEVPLHNRLARKVMIALDDHGIVALRNDLAVPDCSHGSHSGALERQEGDLRRRAGAVGRAPVAGPAADVDLRVLVAIEPGHVGLKQVNQ